MRVLGEYAGRRIDADTRLDPAWSRAVRETFADPVVQAATGPVGYYDVALARLIDGGDALFRRVRPGLCIDAGVHEDVDLAVHLHGAGEAAVFAAGMRAGTSARRIANRFRDYRAYVLMTERTYRRHPGRPRRHAYARAWVTGRVQLLLFPVLRLAYALAQPRPWPVLRRGGGRKNPMRPGR